MLVHCHVITNLNKLSCYQWATAMFEWHLGSKKKTFASKEGSSYFATILDYILRVWSYSKGSCSFKERFFFRFIIFRLSLAFSTIQHTWCYLFEQFQGRKKLFRGFLESEAEVFFYDRIHNSAERWEIL